MNVTAKYSESVSTVRSRFRDIAIRLLDEKSTPIVVLNGARELFDIFCEVSGIPLESSAETSCETGLPYGVAISEFNAARCVCEHQRTSVFLRGIHQAIQALHMRNPGRSIRILYAGCGPFATLVTPLLPLMESVPMEITLIDIHPHCIDHARAIFDAIGEEGRLRDCICCDALEYKASGQFDLLITETMSRALTREPQVAITAHLSRFLADGGLIVPERVSLNVALEDERLVPHPCTLADGSTGELMRFSNENAILQEVFVLDADRAASFRALIDAVPFGDEVDLGCVRVGIPAYNEHVHHLVILTDIVTYGQHVLGLRDCSLCLPLRFDLPEPGRAKTLSVSYFAGSKPGPRPVVLEG